MITTAHDLARQLLALPDGPICIISFDGSVKFHAVELVQKLGKTTLLHVDRLPEPPRVAQSYMDGQSL